MKKGLLTTIIALILVAAVSISAFAFGGRGNGPNQGGFHRFFDGLDLTPDQELKLLEIRQNFQKETQPLRFEIQKKQLELRQLWSAKSLNQNAIEAKEKEISGLRVQMVNKARVMREKMDKVLTAEQRKKLEESGFNCNPGSGRKGRRGAGKRGGSFGA